MNQRVQGGGGGGGGGVFISTFNFVYSYRFGLFFFIYTLCYWCPAFFWFFGFCFFFIEYYTLSLHAIHNAKATWVLLTCIHVCIVDRCMISFSKDLSNLKNARIFLFFSFLIYLHLSFDHRVNVSSSLNKQSFK